MELKVKIQTPKGAATVFDKHWEARLIKRLFFMHSKIKEQWVNDDQSEIYWVVDVHARHYLKVVRNVTCYNSIILAYLDNKLARKSIKRLADTPEDYEKLVGMLKDGTSIEILSQATAEEMVEANKTFWQRIKERFQKKETEI